MTACVNETKKTVGGGVLQSKVLRAVMALVLAIGLMPVGSAWAVDRPSGTEIAGVTRSVDNDAKKASVEYDGESHSLAVDASADARINVEDLNYQWYYEDEEIEGAADSNVYGDATLPGVYSCVITTEVGNTAYSAVLDFEIEKFDISSADVEINLAEGVEKVYQEYVQTLEADEIESVTATKGSVTLTIPAEDYELSNWTNNVNGTATATVDVAADAESALFEGTKSGVEAFTIATATEDDMVASWNDQGTVAIDDVDGFDPTTRSGNVVFTVNGHKVTTGQVTLAWVDADKAIDEDSKVGDTADVKVTWIANATNVAASDEGKTLTLRVVGTDISTETLTITPDTLTYTGKDLSGDVKGELSSTKDATFDLVFYAVDEKGNEAEDPTETVVDAGTYNVYAVGTGNYAGTTAADVLTVNPAPATAVDAKWDGEEIGYTGGDQTELASEHIVATFGDYTLVQGTEAQVIAGEADYWVTWNDKVIGSDDKDTEYTATLHYDGNFTGTETVTMKVLETNPQTVQQEFAEGTLTRVLDNAGNLMQGPSYGFTYDGTAHYIVPKALETNKGVAVDLTERDANGFPVYVVEYFTATGADDDAVPAATVEPLSDSEMVDAGWYKAVVTGVSGDYAECTFVQTFRIAPASLQGAVAVDGCTPAFTWNGQDHTDEIDFVLNGAELTEGDEYAVVGWYKADGTTAVGAVTDAGDYVAKLVGEGNYEGSVEVRVTIAPLDLSTAVLTIDDMVEKGHPAKEYSLPAIDVFASYVDEDGALRPIALKGLVDLEITSGQLLAAERGLYTVEAAPKAGETNVVNSGEATFAIVGEIVTDFQYKGTDFDAVRNVVFNMDRGEALDKADITVRDNDGNKLSADADWTLTVTDLEGNAVPGYAETPGDYIATVTVNYGTDYAMGGKASFPFKVVAGSFAESDIFVSFDGKTIVDAPEGLYWNGQDQSERFSVMVKKDGTTLVEGTDYEWYFTLAGTNVRVDSLTAAGTYDLHVDGLAWVGDWTPIKSIEIQQLYVWLEATGVKTFAQRDGLDVEGYAYTGSEITPTFGWSSLVEGYYREAKGDLEAADHNVVKYQWYNEVTGEWQDVAQVVDEGHYRAFIELTASGEAKFEVLNTTVYFQVVDRLQFQDVLASEWYSERVYEAWAEGYVNGYMGYDGETPLFGPDNAIKRGDVACIMYNVAKAGKFVDNDWEDNAGATTSAFPDVAVDAYWTSAINWAASAKVVNGFADTGLFQPDTNITREQFASILANYAKAMKVYTAPTGDLSDFSDASSVSDWATENVEWAVENGVMGRGGFLNAQGTITRAEVAAMIMNFMEKF